MSGRAAAMPGRPGVSETLACADRSLRGNREVRDWTVRRRPPVRIGKAGAVADDAGREKSDSAIVAGKPTNKRSRPQRSRWSEGRGPRGMRASSL